jgi:hypothetical protein
VEIPTCNRCGNSVFELCPPCSQIAYLHVAWKQMQADAEEEELEREYQIFCLQNSISPELDAFDLGSGLWG